MAREKIYKNLPNHVVIIPDGNRRWAKKHGLAPIEGHRKGLEAAMKVVRESRNLGVKILTLWGFSTENWSRPTLEVKYLMRLYASFFKVHLKELIKEGVRFNWLGRRDRVPKVLRQILEKIEAQTAKNSKYVLNIAIDYGGHEEIIAAFKKILKKGVKPSAINEKLVSENLETADLPDPDLLIRTSGEKRTSGIMPWQTAYTELFFSKLLFPDFSLTELKRAISDFSHRHRRYGE
ncbi:MAG: undecaprenyl pyrophosphate synthase [uncultured bacterium]|uniref:Isoprenyl transferase n=1 Tax=Candidatus Curtissbacteria bacterium RIFOXYA1_FULL_41_14 TaxID=1797737 RepID=A0A1F5HG67_9BACT|nr:MAG: undecaprenyl pyrophosphate synthase [uncultured bacterium]KKR60928.1 MAG: undecaprenyl pyrophosphate synthase, undecaprenyl diphosphate synthase [Microgenomates group bacterium GW2011_GWC1_40_35]KKR75765.1 MAG: undecaprenyl pyrophosphate synthase [Candidatus Curtissbacteria bacterium GW2011_GWD1_40_8]KKS00740.1 MAG: undecaprenyl pyrophosphate synthase [Candidatus Curtissbacteria bacterium GW2011_GWC2_41_21]OGE03134.1 MAG: di-trans,poly-cis-decaprenylcistransferase [Candidatus Curtissbac